MNFLLLRQMGRRDWSYCDIPKPLFESASWLQVTINNLTTYHSEFGL